jgi:hypothetical protein
MSIVVSGDRAWLFEGRECGTLPDAPVHAVLKWMLEQLHLGCWALEENDLGETTTLHLGEAAAPSFAEPVVEIAIKHHQARLTALALSRIFADAREAGVEPEHLTMAEALRLTATDWSYANTEFHYAFELVEVLARIREKTFVFSSPPIKGRFPTHVSALLREATRAYLFNLPRACVAACRAFLEAALSERVDDVAVLQERSRTRKGELECLINVARAKGLLSAKMANAAHRVRRSGNEALHGLAPNDEEAWECLLDVRHLVERLGIGQTAPGSES